MLSNFSLFYRQFLVLDAYDYYDYEGAYEYDGADYRPKPRPPAVYKPRFVLQIRIWALQSDPNKVFESTQIQDRFLFSDPDSVKDDPELQLSVFKKVYTEHGFLIWVQRGSDHLR